MQLKRSVLVIPATNWDSISQSAASEADAILIDLDDYVAPARKVAARANVIRGLNEVDWGEKSRGFRMNALSTPYAYRDLIEVVEATGPQLDFLVIPKVERPEEVYLVDTLLTQIEDWKSFGRRISLEAQIETALGLTNASKIALTSTRLEALSFGPGDFSASLQLPITAIRDFHRDGNDQKELSWHYTMHCIAVAARAAGLQVIDGPFTNVADMNGFYRSCKQARDLGYDGKWCITESQVAVANDLFIGDADEIQIARKIVDRYERALVEGLDEASLDGQVLDAAIIKVALNIVERARRAGLS